MFLDHINSLTERRKSVATTYLSVNAAITAALAFILKDGRLVGLPEQASALALLAAGVIGTSLWRRLTRQHSVLIRWWYEQLRSLERRMSASSGLITKEYNELYSEASRSKPIVGLTRYEINLTWLFTVIYVLFAIGIIVTGQVLI
jgi:hypothetical protein